MDVLCCSGCGRWFVADDGPAMLEALVGPCRCGGRFVLAAVAQGESGGGTPEMCSARPDRAP
jgi:hypothetical protein